MKLNEIDTNLTSEINENQGAAFRRLLRALGLGRAARKVVDKITKDDDKDKDKKKDDGEKK